MSSSENPFKGMFTFEAEHKTYDEKMYDKNGNEIGYLIPGDIVSMVGRVDHGDSWTRFCFRNSENPYDPRLPAFSQKYCPGRGYGLQAFPYQVDESSAQTRFLGLEADCANPKNFSYRL